MSKTNKDGAVDIWRALDWRSQRASNLVNQRRRPSPRNDDPWTAALAAFYRDRNSAGPGSQPRSAPDGLIDAVRLAEENSGLLRGVIQARILAGQPAGEIADGSGLSAKAVGWYESAFFDVRERRVHYDFIQVSVIGPRPADTGGWANLQWLWKRVAYLGGVSALDDVLGYLGLQDGLQDSDQLSSVTEGTRQGQRIMEAQWQWAASTNVNPLDPYIAARLGKRAAQEAAAESDSDPEHRKYLRNAAKLVALLGKNVRVGGRGGPPDPLLGAYDEAGIELSSLEQLALGLGYTPAEVDRVLKNGMPWPDDRGSHTIYPAES